MCEFMLWEMDPEQCCYFLDNVRAKLKSVRAGATNFALITQFLECRLVSASALEEIQKYIGLRPFSVVAIVGGYRTGKSALGNMLIGEDKFKVGTTIHSETLSFDAVVVIDENDADAPAIVLIDTPGTQALEFSVEDQAAYFGAAYLISSSMIFNAIRQVGNRNDVDFLARRLRNALSV